MSKSKKISVVVSVYNEELSLDSFYKTTSQVLESCKWDYELIFVNDGSSDGSLSLLEKFAEKSKKVKVVNFARNFGHEAAMIAGIDHSCGDGIVCMDADLQHPPECIYDIIEKFEDGYDVISMVRTKNEDAGLVKKITSAAFYRVLNMVSSVKFETNASDFFAISKSVAEVLKKDYREKVRYLRGYVQSVGFNKTTLEFEARKREAGESKYNIMKLLKFSINALCSFSDIPLKLGLFSGVILGVIGVILGVAAIVLAVTGVGSAAFLGITAVLCILFAVTLVVIGMLGEYLAVMFAEIKDRPIYIVRNVIGEEDDD